MTERVIITPELLIQMFGKYELRMMLYILAPFTAGEAEALFCFDSTISLIEKGPDEPGKKMAMDCFKEMKSAYLKMTIFERESVRKGLPDKIAEFLRNKT